MWISKRRIKEMEERISGLEKQIRGQKESLMFHLEKHTDEAEEMKKALSEVQGNLTAAIGAIKGEMIKTILQQLSH